VPESHDPVRLAAYLHRTPAAYTMHLRAHSLTQLEHLHTRAAELPDGHRAALTDEINLRHRNPWMRDGPGME